jgi:hypothetical protein
VLSSDKYYEMIFSKAMDKYCRKQRAAPVHVPPACLWFRGGGGGGNFRAEGRGGGKGGQCGVGLLGALIVIKKRQCQ